MPNAKAPDRTLPYNTDAEQAVLGSMLIDPACIPDVILTLEDDDFYLQKHRWIYAAMVEVFNRDGNLDFLTLGTYLEQVGHLPAIGGAVYISELASCAPSAVNATMYATLVHETALRRRLLDAASTIAQLAYKEETDIGDVLSQAEGAVFKVRQGQRNDSLITIKQAVRRVSDHFDAIERGEIPAAISTGYTDIDRIMTGWRRQEFTILASRPGIGKTALTTALILKSAIAGYGTLFFSAEMSYEQIVKRMVQAAGVQNFPGNAKFRDNDWPELYERMAEIDGLPLWIDDTPNISVMDIRAKAMRLASQHRIDHIFVDYIQLIKPPVRRPQRYLEVGDISKMLKQICREMDCHLTCAAQLGRGAEGIIPTLEHLKESGALEEDADNAWLLYRDRECIITPTKKTFEAKVIIAKQRNGPTGIVELGWYPERTTFVPITKREQENDIQTRPGRDWSN